MVEPLPLLRHSGIIKIRLNGHMELLNNYWLCKTMKGPSLLLRHSEIIGIQLNKLNEPYTVISKGLILMMVGVTILHLYITVFLIKLKMNRSKMN